YVASSNKYKRLVTYNLIPVQHWRTSYSFANDNLSVNIHSCHIRLIVPLNHTQKFPAVSFIKTLMICNQIDRSNSFRLHIFYNYIQQLSRDPLATIFLFRIYRTYIWFKVLPVMKIIFNHAKTAYNALAV